MKKILILGTGSAQRDIIQHCKDRGFYVIATSNIDGYSAQKLADEFYQIDITDIDATEALAKKKRIDYIYSIGSDIATQTIAKVSCDLDLPCFVDPEVAYICNHKHVLREVLSTNMKDFSVPYQLMANTDEEITIPFPLVMKPSDSQGQRGVRKVNSEDELKEFFNQSLAFSREKKVIIEQYIEGDEVSVHVFLENGEMLFYQVSDRIVWDDYPGGLIKRHILPSKYEEDKIVSSRIKHLVNRSIEVFGFRNGPIYYQIKINKDGRPYVIEITPRLDGCHMWRLIKMATQVDLLQATVDMLEGISYRQPLSFEAEKYYLEFLCEKPGTEFQKESFHIPNNDFLQWYYENGKRVNRMNGYLEKCGYFIKKGS